MAGVSPMEKEKAVNLVLCELCEEEDASSFCNVCILNLGESCLTVHKKQKATKSHSITTLEANILRLNLQCASCENQAEAFCIQCKETLCNGCSKIHKKIPVTKMHDLTDVLPSDYNEPLDNAGEQEPDVIESEVQQGNHDRPRDTTIGESGHDEYVPLDVPGKPYACTASTDNVTIAWTKPGSISENDIYQIRYKEEGGEKWIFHHDQFEQNQGNIYGLKSGTTYIFKARTVHSDGESPYSPDSIGIKTHATFASELVNCSTNVGNEITSPAVYALPTTENMRARNDKHLTKKCDIGDKSMSGANEKTIMLLGATGTGKSTLVDGLANYVLGVNFEDQYRFTVIDSDERKKQSNQAISQTDWITCYSFNPQKGTRINYQLNIIDTPGFGDTRGLERDHKIVEQIRHLFEQTGERGVQYVDAVCFLVKAPDARLTATQRYIFNAIMSIFGKDIENNICTLITFADGSNPPVLSAIKECDLPFGRHFTFNNSALFAETANEMNPLAPMFWNMGMKSFDAFFDYLKTKETKSIQLTKEVLQERKRLEVSIQTLQPQIDVGLSTIERINKEIKIFEKNQATIRDNKNFKYKVDEVVQEKIDLSPGRHVTNCLQCNMTCHEVCYIADDDQKRRCAAMDNAGNCRQCHKKCFWTQHKNTRYIIRYKTVTVEKAYAEMLKKYQEAEGKTLSHKQLLKTMESNLETLTGSIEDKIKEIQDCNNKLKAIALRPNPLGMKDQIKLMIMSEEKEQKDGYLDRIGVLNEFLKKANIGDTVKKFRDEKSKTSKLDKVLNFFGLRN